MAVSKRDRLIGLMESGGRWDYVPAGFFMHFDRDHHVGQAAVDKHVEFFRATDMDFVKIQFELSFPPFPIERPEDWGRVPQHGLDFYEGPLRVVKGLVDALGNEALIVLTLYSPFMVANNIAGPAKLAAALDEHPEEAAKAIQITNNSLIGFVDACVDAGLDGFYHSTQGGESHRFKDPSTFTHYVKPVDLAIMGHIKERCQFNILHICDYHRDEYGDYPDLSAFLDYPGQVINSSLHTEGGDQTPSGIAKFFNRPFMGGIDRKGPLATGSEEDARRVAREVLAEAPDQFILGADCTVPGTTPWENLRAAIDEAHRARE